MSVPVKFSDIGKSVSDLLNKDIPVNTVKVEANTQTASGVVRVSSALCCARQPHSVLKTRARLGTALPNSYRSSPCLEAVTAGTATRALSSRASTTTPRMVRKTPTTR